MHYDGYKKDIIIALALILAASMGPALVILFYFIFRNYGVR